jgi:hypothetical protein
MRPSNIEKGPEGIIIWVFLPSTQISPDFIANGQINKLKVNFWM